MSNSPVTRSPRYPCWYGNGTISARREVCRDTAVMNDDLGGPATLAAVHATVRDGNYALSTEPETG